MLRFLRVCAWLVLLFYCLVGRCMAEDVSFKCTSELAKPERDSLMAKIEARYGNFSDLRAEFIQKSYFMALDQWVVSKGRVFFKKPGMMDWNYTHPEKQRFVADGTTLWFFEPDLNQVTVGDFKDAFSSDLPVSFLLGIGRLAENFDLSSACVSSRGVVLSLATRKQDPNLDEFYLLVRRKDHVPIGAKVIDIGGNETIINFYEVTLDLKLAEGQFSFTIPRGVDVIDRRTEGKVGSVQ